MKNTVTGKIEGNIIRLDSPIPSLDGCRVNVTIEPMEEGLTLSAEENEKLWGEWKENGPQGQLEGFELE